MPQSSSWTLQCIRCKPSNSTPGSLFPLPALVERNGQYQWERVVYVQQWVTKHLTTKCKDISRTTQTVKLSHLPRSKWFTCLNTLHCVLKHSSLSPIRAFQEVKSRVWAVSQRDCLKKAFESLHLKATAADYLMRKDDFDCCFFIPTFCSLIWGLCWWLIESDWWLCVMIIPWMTELFV